MEFAVFLRDYMNYGYVVTSIVCWSERDKTFDLLKPRVSSFAVAKRVRPSVRVWPSSNGSHLLFVATFAPRNGTELLPGVRAAIATREGRDDTTSN